MFPLHLNCWGKDSKVLIKIKAKEIQRIRKQQKQLITNWKEYQNNYKQKEIKRNAFEKIIKDIQTITNHRTKYLSIKVWGNQKYRILILLLRIKPYIKNQSNFK